MRILEPHRHTYRSRRLQNTQCQFCNQTNRKKQIVRSLSSDQWNVWVNVYPYLNGNLMIIPREHIERVQDIPGEMWSDFQQVLIRVQKVLGTLFKTNDFNIGLNLGPNSGGTIRHMHWQIVPRPHPHLQNSYNIFADLHVITMSPNELKRKLERSR